MPEDEDEDELSPDAVGGFLVLSPDPLEPPPSTCPPQAGSKPIAKAK
jgi:hypothetical protein